MELSKAAKRWVVLTVALLFLVAAGSAEAYPGVEPSSPDRTISEEGSDAKVRLARRRRRKRRRRRPKKKKAETEAQTTQEAPEGGASAGGASAPPTGTALRRGARVEFDGRLVQGQTAKSGAIYLFARKRSELRSMVKERTSYRKEILRTIYPNDEYQGPRK